MCESVLGCGGRLKKVWGSCVEVWKVMRKGEGKCLKMKGKWKKVCESGLGCGGSEGRCGEVF